MSGRGWRGGGGGHAGGIPVNGGRSRKGSIGWRELREGGRRAGGGGEGKPVGLGGNSQPQCTRYQHPAASTKTLPVIKRCVWPPN